MRPILLGLAAGLALAACGGGSYTYSGGRPEGQAVSGDYSISWRQLRSEKGPREATPLLFVFDWNDAVKAEFGYATEADIQREAERLGINVNAMRRMYGSESYVKSNGHLATCTYLAIEKGVCGKRLNLSVSERVALARKALEQQGRCRWIGFDPGFDAQHFMGAAQNATLWIKADCR